MIEFSDFLGLVAWCVHHWKLVAFLVVLSIGWSALHSHLTAAALAGQVTPGDPFAGGCKPTVTQPYGSSNLVGEPVINGIRTHTGIDLACAAGAPIHTIATGVAHISWDSGFGNSVIVATGGYVIRYAHLSGPAISDGTPVQAGDVIGWEGSTGFSTGPHLHFEVDRGAPLVQDAVDPRPYLTVPS